MNKAAFYTAEEIVQRGKENIPSELVSSKNLVYSSPATLAYNSPGAQGFGVKRAGLALPESVMLLVAPRCCKLFHYAHPHIYLLISLLIDP